MYYFWPSVTQFLVAIMYWASRRCAAYEPMGRLHVLILGVGALRTSQWEICM